MLHKTDRTYIHVSRHNVTLHTNFKMDYGYGFTKYACTYKRTIDE